MGRSSLASLLLVLLFSTAALGVAKGGKLYIKSKDTALLKAPKPGAVKVATLQPGDEVTWLGPSEKDKTFHLVEVNGKKGFVLMSNLSPNKPLVGNDGTPMSRDAFLNSGAHVSCPPQDPRYQSVADNEAAAELIYLEEFNKAKGTPAALRAKDKELRAAQQ